ncbi:MAG: hypothetical protein AAF617_02915 [Bacteroidota bacterium]
MKIHYHKETKTLVIDDNSKTQARLINFIAIANIFNASVWMIKSKDGFGTMELIWLTIGIISLATLCYTLLKQSNVKKIPVANIRRLNTKTVFGKKRHILQLTNGKYRKLSDFKTDTEYADFQQLLQELEIPN